MPLNIESVFDGAQFWYGLFDVSHVSSSIATSEWASPIQKNGVPSSYVKYLLFELTLGNPRLYISGESAEAGIHEIVTGDDTVNPVSP